VADTAGTGASASGQPGGDARFKPASIKLVIFDCDGVLIDSEPIASSTFAQALNEVGVAITAREALVNFTGFSERESRQFCRDKLGVEDVDGLFRLWSGHLYRGFRRLQEMDGVRAAISALDCHVCVASNSSLYRLTRSLGRLDLWQFFEGQVFSADMVVNPKPAPDLLLLCAREFGVDPSECVMIDDSPHGIASAIAAGMVPIGFVDLNDPRPARRRVLEEHGATLIAEGGSNLLRNIIDADGLLSAMGSVAPRVASHS
jgi:beta-phosphoglucomutase-like phosphatase (HAD superfamily)